MTDDNDTTEEFKCDNCPKTFETAAALGNHEPACTGEASSEASGPAVPEAGTPIAQNVNGFAELYPRQVTPHKTTVLSTRNDANTAHVVDIKALTCTCEDFEHNLEGNEICDHLAVALYQARRKFKVEEALVGDLARFTNDLQEITARLDQSAGDGAETDTAASEAMKGEDSDMAGVDAEDAADRLQEAFDDAIEDMQVQAAAGKVWFQTGRDTPEEWPYPGASETFDVITSPDVVEFVHDGSADWADGPHRWHDDKPGEWFKNALEPGDVETYIGEVTG